MFFCFFFSSRRRHTRYWRDWSSDVCSSDLHPGGETAGAAAVRGAVVAARGDGGARACFGTGGCRAAVHAAGMSIPSMVDGGDRKRVVLGKRVDFGGRRII